MNRRQLWTSALALRKLNDMSWTTAELAALYANIYARRMVCPSCNGPLLRVSSDEPRNAAEASDPAGSVVICRTCHVQHFVSRHNDPLGETFRPYTPAEQRQIIADDRRRKTPTCPIDGTPMAIYLQRSLARTSNVIVSCRRCKQTAEYVRTCG